MFKKIINIFYLLLFSIFVVSTISYYFSDNNMKKTNKIRSYYLTETERDFVNIPLLKSDTQEIIEYTDDVEIFKKSKKKYKFWDLIKEK